MGLRTRKVAATVSSIFGASDTLHSLSDTNHPTIHSCFPIHILRQSNPPKIERLFGEPNEGDGDHRQRSAGEDQFWVGPGAAEQIGKRQECGEDGELAEFHSDVGARQALGPGIHDLDGVTSNLLLLSRRLPVGGERR